MAGKEEYDQFLGVIRKQTGLEMLVPDADGLVSVRVQDEYTVSLQFLEETGKILCFVEMTTLPPNAGKAVYRKLLTGGLFGKETAGGYFALDAASETVVYHYFFDFNATAADPEGFVETLEKILSLMDLWNERIRALLTPETGKEISPDTPHNDFVLHP